MPDPRCLLTMLAAACLSAGCLGLPPCDASSCADGCCGSDGVCYVDATSSPAHCGVNGGACANCGSGSCNAGVCCAGKGSGGTCGQTSECCAGLICTSSATCGTCASSGSSCTTARDCCSGLACLSGSQCGACLTTGTNCTFGTDCCSGSCQFDTGSGSNLCQ